MKNIFLKLKFSYLLLFTTVCFSQTFEIKYEYKSYTGNLINEATLIINDSVSQFICDFKAKKFKVGEMDGVQEPRYYINNFYLKDKNFTENSTYKNKDFISKWKYDYNWVMTEEVDTIIGFKVKKAFLETNTKAGKLFAWFSTEIPLSGGPFRYCGLPGLILKINYEKINTTINAIEIKEVDNNQIQKINNNAISLTKEEMFLFDENILDVKIKQN